MPHILLIVTYYYFNIANRDFVPLELVPKYKKHLFDIFSS